MNRRRLLRGPKHGLINKQIVGRDADGSYRAIEPFLAEWLLREQRDYDMSDLTRNLR